MREVEFRVLGPLEARVEGRALELKRRKQRALLALLLLHAGEVVPADRLIDELWAGEPPKAAAGSLRNLISGLRKALGADRLRTHPPGYALDVEREWIDLYRFESLVTRAAESVDAEPRSDLLREALGLWRGPPLADLSQESFAAVEITRLEELRTAAREDLIDAQLELGRHAQLVPELESLVVEHPLRERLRGQLMLALYRSGRQAEALEAYRSAREALVEELGIEPSTALQELERAILRHESELDFEAGTGAAPAPDAERRKTVTILVTDVVDSATLAEELDPEVLRRVMHRYFDTVRAVAEQHGGEVESSFEGAAIAVFGLRQVREDDALRAVHTATGLGEALVDLNAGLEQDYGVAIQIRTGINTGEVLAGAADSDLRFPAGAPVGVALRLHEAALPGETLLGEATCALVVGAVSVEPVEQIDAVAGGAMRAYRLVELRRDAGVRPASRARFVGRRDELAALTAAFESVVAERRSRVVVLLGDAGIGKTRLVSELVATLGGRARTLIGRCVSYGEGATYLPLREIVHQLAPERQQETIERLLEGHADASVVAARVTQLAGQNEGTAPTGELFWATRRLLEVLAQRRPLIVAVEDLHWAEPTLLDLVEYLTAWPAEAPFMLVCTARPGLHEERPGLGADLVRVPPLEESAVDLLVGSLAQIDMAPDVQRRIASLAEGNPLFVEQLLALVADAGPGALESVPPSVEALLASRLDRLEADDRALLERAAVAGREFMRAAIVNLTPPAELVALDRRLSALAAGGLIEATRLQDDFLRFHHVLIRDVAYAGITKQRRADLHEVHGTWLDARNEADELVGYHAEQAHRYRMELQPSDPDLNRLAAWAAERLARAGIRAWKRADTPATVNLLGRATALLPADAAERPALLCELGVAQRVSGDFDAGRATLIEAREAASGVRDRSTKLRAQIELAELRLFRDPEGASAELLELAGNAIPVFEELNDERALGRTWRHVGYVRSLEGRLGDWTESVEQALPHYRRSGWSASGCLAELASALLYGPTPVAEARARCEQLLDEATDRLGEANVLAFLAGLGALDARFDDARLQVARAATIYEELGEAHAWANNSGRVLGRIEMLAGDPAAAARILQECCETFERMHDASGLSNVAAELGDALYAQGRYDEAGLWLGVAQERAASDDVSAQWSWRRTRAKLLARAGALREAEATAGEAERIAARTDALSDHGAVLLDVAEVLRLAGRPTEAAERIEHAILLFDRKGNRVSSNAGRALLTELTVA